MIDRDLMTYGWVIAGVVILLLFIPFLSEYLPWTGTTYIGLVTILFTYQKKKNKRRTITYLSLGFLSIIVFYFFHIQFLWYAGICFLLFSITKRIFGSMNVLPVVACMLTSTLSNHLAGLFSFPVRLWLTNITAKLLQNTGQPVEAIGNSVSIDGALFTVDTACLGLNMFITSAFIAILIMGHFERKYNRHLRITEIGCLLAIALTLNIATNLIRMCLLIIFRSPPEALSHDMIGIVSLVFYMVAPFYGIVYLFFKRNIKITSLSILGHVNISSKMANSLLSMTILLFLLVLPSSKQRALHQVDQVIEQIEWLDFEKMILQNRVVQLKRDDALIYIKPKVPVYRGDHSPLFCWRGSGYVLKKEAVKTVGDQPVMMAELHRDQDILYTAWWYSNGTEHCNGQLKWRWQTVKQGKAYRLINVTTTQPDHLACLVKDLLEGLQF